MLSSLAGCSVNKPESVGIEYCIAAKPILFESENEVDDTPINIQRQILENNEIYKRLCE